MLRDPTRRQAIAGLSAVVAALHGRPVRGLGASSQLDVAELMLPSGSTSRPAAWARLLYEVIQTTSVEADPRAVQLEPDDPALFAHPFSVLVGTGGFDPLSAVAVEQLRRYLSYGGFLLLDDATGSPDGPFAASVRRLGRRLFPTRPLSPLPGDHSIYRAFFLLDAPLGRVAVADVLEGVTKGPTTPLVYCPNDLSGALDRGPDGTDRHPVVPGGAAQRREAKKLGINLVMYSLTSNYKHDQAHVAELMRDGKLE
ncbi:MAG: DUF4159 domain-containing protein [Myxococcota bacterium]|nr:DUF4159 domain-containing protein [Myxococcota bacterium]